MAKRDSWGKLLKYLHRYTHINSGASVLFYRIQRVFCTASFFLLLHLKDISKTRKQSPPQLNTFFFSLSHLLAALSLICSATPLGKRTLRRVFAAAAGCKVKRGNSAAHLCLFFLSSHRQICVNCHHIFIFRSPLRFTLKGEEKRGIDCFLLRTENYGGRVASGKDSSALALHL